MFYMHCACACKSTASTDKNCGDENKNVLKEEEKKLQDPVPYLTVPIPNGLNTSLPE